MRPAMQQQRWRLAAHVRACKSDDSVILLDLRRNKYLGIGNVASKAIASFVEDWPDRADGIPGDCATTGSPDVLQQLVSKGLLTDRSPPLMRAEPELEEATSSLGVAAPDAEARANALALLRLGRCALTATLWMRFRSLHAIATAVSGRRTHAGAAPCSITSADAARRGAAVYEHLRPWVSTADENCLLDSLTMVGFLARANAYPCWVIGVKTRPFGAHSWVQCGAMVLNDQHENVRRFRPILVA